MTVPYACSMESHDAVEVRRTLLKSGHCVAEYTTSNRDVSAPWTFECSRVSKRAIVIDCCWVRSERVRNVYWSALRCCWISHPCVYIHADGTNNAGSKGMNPSARGAKLTKLTEVWDNVVVVTDWPSHMIGTMNFKEWNILRASRAASIFKQVCKRLPLCSCVIYV